MISVLFFITSRVANISTTIEKYIEIFKVLPDSSSLTKSIFCYFIVKDLCNIDFTQDMNPNSAVYSGLMNVFPSENPAIKTALINISSLEDINAYEKIKYIVSQPICQSRTIFNIHSDLILKRYYQIIELSSKAKNSFTDGVYCITGGTGGVGIAIAKFISERCRSHIVIVSRTLNIDKKTINELKKAADRLTLIKSDISNFEEFSSALLTHVQSDRNVEMIIHCAGVSSGGVMGHGEYQWQEEVYSPKLQGAKNVLSLNEVFNIRRIILFSSISAHIGGLGQIDYVTANTVMEKIAEKYQGKYNNIKVIAWDVWKGVGMSKQNLNNNHPQSDYFIEAVDALNAFQIALSMDIPLIIVSGLEWNRRVAFDYINSLTMNVSTEHKNDYLTHKKITYHDMVKKLEEIWGSTFNTVTIDKNKYVCELGGSSLTAMYLLKRINNYFNTSVNLRFFLENSTIEKFAPYLFELISKD